MGDIEADLRSIWARYAQQRQSDADAVRTAIEASAELLTLNERRRGAGLGPVVEPSMVSGFAQQMAGQQLYAYPPPKTWRDELDAELLAAVKRWLK